MQSILHPTDADNILQIAGVSYTDDHTGENRQQLLASLLRHGRNSSGAGIPLLFVKQPDNPVDPQAVAVMSGAVCSWLLQTGQPQPVLYMSHTEQASFPKQFVPNLA